MARRATPVGFCVAWLACVLLTSEAALAQTPPPAPPAPAPAAPPPAPAPTDEPREPEPVPAAEPKLPELPPSAATSAPVLAPADVAAPPTASASPAPGPAPDTRAACLLVPGGSFQQADSLTAAGLVCQALRDEGVEVDDHPRTAAEAASSAYRVELRPLGRAVILKVAFERPIGHTQASRSLQLTELEDVAEVAPRVAKSLHEGKPLEPGDELPAKPEPHGEMKAGLGLFGLSIPGTGVDVGYGLLGKLDYETLDYSLGGDLRIGASGSQQGDPSYVGVALGARYFFAETDSTPFAGAGLGALWLAYDDTGAHGHGRFTGSGVAAHGLVGVEFLRRHDVRFELAARADLPFFAPQRAAAGSYRVPLSISAAFSFQ